MAQTQGISQKVAIGDPASPTHVLKPNADGSINVSGGGGGSTSVTANALSPTWVEGSTTNAISGNLHGAMRFLPQTPTGTAVDLSAPASIIGADGTTIVSNSNPMPISDAGGTITVDGTVAATQSGPWNVTNVSGTVSLPTGAATEASLVKVPLAQGSTTSGQSGALVQGAVTTAAPSYTTAQTSPFSLTTGGALRTEAVGNVANNVADVGNPVKVGGIYSASGALGGLTAGTRGDAQIDNVGNLRVRASFLKATAGDGFANTSMYLFPDVASNNSATGGYGLVGGTLFNGGTTWDRIRSIAGTFGSATGVQAVESAGAAFAYIGTATTTQVKSGAGILHKIIVNTGVAAATISVIDNTSGSTVNLALITLPAAVGNPFTLDYDLSFANGLRIITSGATDITVVYR